MLQRVPIALEQAKLRNASEDLITEVREIVYFLLEKRKSPKKYKTIWLIQHRYYQYRILYL